MERLVPVGGYHYRGAHRYNFQVFAPGHHICPGNSKHAIDLARRTVQRS